VTKDFKQFYFILFVLSFFILLVIILAKYPGKEIKRIKFTVIGRLLKNNKLLFLCIYIIIGAGTMYSISGWMPTLFQKNLGMSQVLSNYMLSLFWLAIIIGRLVTALLCKKYKEIRILSWTNIAIIILLIISFFLNNPIFIMVIYFLLGLSMGGFFPLIVAISSDIYPEFSASRISLIFASSVIGMLIVPTSVGLFADSFVIYRIISFMAVFFLAYLYIFNKKFEAKS
jgi:FHS family glucose/mannose:H+ symporter-like MFS transporter